MHEAQYGAPGPINQSRPVADPQHQSAASLLSFYNTSRIVMGSIVGATAIANAYKVFFEKAKQPGIAYLAPRSSCSASGPRELTTLQPGTMVACICHEQMPYSLIIGVLPPPNITPGQGGASVLFNASRSRVDEMHRKPLRMPFAGMMADMLAGRPFDATNAGEVGWIAPTGVRIFMDNWLASLGVDEMCGVTAFYHDQLLRLAGYNFQHWTAGREHESMNDQDEILDWFGVATYPHEQLGNFVPGGDPSVLKTATEWQVDTPWYGKVEADDDWRMPFHRTRQFFGYLGQGGKFSVQGPPVQTSQHASYAGGQGIDAPYPGLIDIAKTVDGRLLVQVAKGVSVAKRAAIVSPARLRRPEQPDGTANHGDAPSNYKFSGRTGNGVDHAITGDVAIPATTEKNLSRAAGLLDLHSYFFNHAAVHPFFYHANDYAVPEESELGPSVATPPFQDLGSQMYLDTEPFKTTRPVDHRYGDSDYYGLSCGYDLLDDGGVVWYGGCGEEIRFVAGSIVLACPGDIWLKSGRNVVQWAGGDLIMRAKNSADLTVTEGDIRHKAEHNYHVTSGNDGTGSLLLENRADAGSYDFSQLGEAASASGIILKSKAAPVVAIAAGVYIRTGGGDVATGPIYLDANQGSDDIVTNSLRIVSYLQENHTQLFGTQGGVTKGNTFGADKTTICAPTQIAGRVAVNGDVAIKGNFLAASGHVITEGASASTDVGVLEGTSLSDTYQAAADGAEDATSGLSRVGDQYFQGLTEEFYADARPGNADTITSIQFSLRQLSDYRTSDFRVYEDRWQQMGRLAGTVGEAWTERPVVCGGIPTYPYPGREKFEGDTLMQQDLTLFSPTTGNSNDRGTQPNLATEYRNPTLATPSAVNLSQYSITHATRTSSHG